MRVRYGNLKIPGDDLSPWRVMALVAQPKQVALSNSSRTNSKVYPDSDKMRYTQSKEDICTQNSMSEIYLELYDQVTSRAKF